MGCERDDWNVTPGIIGAADHFGCQQAVHFWHLNVHEDEVEFLLTQEFDGFNTIIGNGEGKAHSINNSAHQFLIDGVIFCKQHVARPVFWLSFCRDCGC